MMRPVHLCCCALLWTAGCLVETLPSSTSGATIGDANVDASEGSQHQASADGEPTAQQFAATAASLPRPWTVARVRLDDGRGEARLALAYHDEDRWLLGYLFDQEVDLCESYPCDWPSELVPETPLVESPPIAGAARDAVAYAQTLLTFEGELSIYDDDSSNQPSWMSELPSLSLGDAPEADFAPFLDRLRRYHPLGRCSMDRWPQTVAAMRARAAAQSGHMGWTVQGWLDAVGYFSSARTVWSSYGQSHPQGHLALLQMVDVDVDRFFAGVVLELPGLGRSLGVADARRVAPDFGPEMAQRLRELAADPSIDPLNRARLFVIIASEPLEKDPLLAELPPLSREIVDYWLQ